MNDTIHTEILPTKPRTMRLLGDRLYVRKIPSKPSSHGGILLPESFIDDKSMWRVLMLGTGVKEDIRVGDAVLTGMYGSNDHEFPDGTRIIKVQECRAVVRSEESSPSPSL